MSRFLLTIKINFETTQNKELTGSIHPEKENTQGECELLSSS